MGHTAPGPSLAKHALPLQAPSAASSCHLPRPQLLPCALPPFPCAPLCFSPLPLPLPYTEARRQPGTQARRYAGTEARGTEARRHGDCFPLVSVGEGLEDQGEGRGRQGKQGWEAGPAAESCRIPCTTCALAPVKSEMPAMGPSCDDASCHCTCKLRPPHLPPNTQHAHA